MNLMGCERENVRTTLDVVLNIEDPYFPFVTIETKIVSNMTTDKSIVA
jgi:hypothetical protein